MILWTARAPQSDKSAGFRDVPVSHLPDHVAGLCSSHSVAASRVEK